VCTSGVIDRFVYALLARTTGAAIERIIRFDAVPDDLAAAVLAYRR
jgi:hypothetical protein